MNLKDHLTPFTPSRRLLAQFNAGFLRSKQDRLFGRACLMLACLLISSPLIASAQPNVIVILADDVSARNYSLYGADTAGDWGVVSPVVETMAEQGLYFDTAWCIPRCTPTRALLHTGKYPFRTRVFGQQIYPRGGNGLIKPIDQRFPNTMGTLMAANGYRTAMIGKIATGDVQGLGYQNWCIVNQGRIFDMTFSDHDIDGTRVVDPDTHSTDANFDYLRDFTAVQGESPWFVYMSLNLPHEVYDGSSYSPPPVPELDGNWELTGNLVSNDFPATLRYIDYKLGGFIDHLEATGQLMNTVIIYCGDNGVGRYGKSNPDSEKGPRVPFVVYAPGLLAPTGVSDELIDFSDIVPTVVELAGGTLPTDDVFDGRSFAPLILGEPFEGRDWIFSQWKGCRWLRTDRWLLDGRGTFYDCGTHRNEWEGTYLDVTESMDSEVVAARKQVGRVLDELPLPDFYDPELANDWQNEWLNNNSFLEPYVPPYLGGVAEGSFENPLNIVGPWGMFPAVWNDTWTSQYEVGAPGHLSRAADGDWAALLSNTGTIVQDLGLAVNEGETVKVTFQGGRAEEDKNTAGGGVIECTFIVDSVRYSMTADTTLLPEDTWQLYTHEVTATNSGDLTLEFAHASGTPWLDAISDITVTPIPVAESPGPHHLEWRVPSGSIQQLSWVAGVGALSYDVHFGTSEAAVSGSAAFQGNQSGATFDTPALAADTIYYWRVDVVTSTGTIAGPVWSFRTDNRARYDVPDTVLENNFANPPNEFRIVKYQLTNSNLVQYPQYGFGGYQGFFYNNLYKNAAGGVDGIGPLVDAANAQGRTVWGADDNGYPSGSAGGLVVTNNPEYEVRGVAMLSTAGSGQVPVSISTPADCEKMVSAVLYPVAGGVPDYSQGQVQSVQDSGVSTTGLAGDWKLCAFVLQIRDSNTQAQNKAEQFGSTGHYPDLLNSNAVASWISLMHEPIVAEITDPASKFEGFYFNEPSLMQLNWETTAPYACLSWNAGLTGKFQTMHGYDLEQVMAALYGGNDLSARRVRMHYHQTVAEMMRTSFTGQIAEWCGQRGIVTSGHPLLEESLHMQVANFGDMMKVFGEVQVPAVDLAMPEPGRMATENYHFPKQMSSMGAWNEYDRRVVGLLDPVIGGNGGRPTPSEDVIHNIVNHSAASGVNSFSTYIRAHDPAYGGTEVFERVNEYAGRISSMLTGARVASDVALYYPINMFQMEYKPITGTHWNTWDPQRQKNWDDLQEDMLSADVNYNIVHPEWVRDAVIEGGELKIGSGSYRYLVMPDVEIISSSVLARIQQFEAAGGTVLWVDSKPSAGAYSSEDAQVNAAVAGYSTVSAAQVPGLISDPYGERFKLQVASSGILTTRFNRSGRSLYYLVNPTGSPLTAQLDYGGGSGTLKICDPVSGEITEAVQSAEVVIDGYRSALVFSDPYPSSSVTDGSFENPPGTHSTWRTCHTGWNPTVTNPYQILNPNGTHFDAAVDGDWCAFLNNLGTISQELNMMVEAGDTLSVAFYAGRGKDSSGSAGGGAFTCTLRVGDTPYSMTVDTTLQDENSWQKHTHNVTITNSGPLALEFSSVSGKLWIDHISDVVVELVTAPTGLTAVPGIGGISLDWDDHPDGDFESYTVYRSPSSGGGYVQIASSLVDSEFTDTTAVPDANSYYVVVAIDAEGNRSLFSTEVSVGQPKPNVITILIDDMGWSDSSTYGSTYYQTPNLTRLAEEGMLFTDAYAASLCSPTRASIMSGQHPARLRMTVAITSREVAEPQVLEPEGNNYLGLVESRNHLPLEVNTLAETMKTSGYHTAHIGKWHLTPSTGGAAFNADHQGFDYVIGGDHRAGPPDYYSPYNIRNLTDGPDGEYLNERLADECIQWIDSVKDSSQPFYLNFWHYAVHGPIIPKEDLMPKYEALRDPNNPQRCPEMATMIESMDNSIGLLLDWLDLPENSELKANTMIVLTSDNGGVTHNQTGNGDTWTSNRPLRGGKGNTYEGGLRVPWIVSWPGRVEAGTTNATPVQTIDIYPTVLEAAGIAQPAGTVLDGESIVPLLNGTSSEHQPVFSDFPHIFGILCAPSACVRDGDWKLIRYYHAGEDAASHAYELFDLSRDPAEAINLAAYFPDKVAELDLLIDAHLVDTDALVPIASTSYSGSAIDVPRGSAAAAPNRPVSLRLPETEIRTLAAGSRTIRLLDQDDQPRTTHALVLEGDEWVSVENQPDGSVLVQWDAQPSYMSARLLFGWKGGETTREMNDWTFGPYELLIGIDSEIEGDKEGFSQSVLMGHSYFMPGANDIKVLAPYYGYTRHTQFTQGGGGTNGDPGSLWRDTGENEGAKAEIKKGTTEVLGLTLFSLLDGDSEYEDYKQWIDFTLQHNPDTFDTFFIMIPWASYANNPTYSGNRASQDTVNEYVHDIIQQLRVEYPQLTCLAMPVGEAMSRLWRLYDEGQLGPEILGVKQNGNRDNYLQYDNIGHAGKIMEDTLGLIWQKTLYPETDIRTVADPPTFQHDWTYDIRQLAYEIWQDDPYAHRYNDTADDFVAYISDPAFALDPSEQGMGDDPDGDGIPNGLEAWFGTHPGTFNTGLVLSATDGATITLTHPHNENPPSDQSGFYEWSPNLADWYLGDGMDGPSGGPSVSIAPNPSGATATTSELMETLFLRLRVIQN